MTSRQTYTATMLHNIFLVRNIAAQHFFVSVLFFVADQKYQKAGIFLNN